MNDKQKQLAVIVVIAALGVLGFFQLAQQGKIPLNFENLKLKSSPQTQVQNTETRTIIQEENAVISVVEKSSPSVVAIGLSQRLVNPFDPFSAPRQGQNMTIGTGFVVSDKGIIVTNKHVVSDPNGKYSIATRDGKKLEITKIYRDPTQDLALVKVNNDGIKALDLGDSSKLKVGQTVIAIGNALGRFENTVTTGVVSGLGRTVVAGDPYIGDSARLDDLIQTDAAINPGNSGGPLLNSAGQVIGVNVATTEGAQNIGFAIPINSIKALAEEFDRTGTIQRTYLGVSYRLITRDLALLNEVPQGAYIQEVLAGSPAEKAGIQAGDIITKIDGQQVNSDTKVSEVIQKKKVGEQISLEVWTDGKTRTVNATLAQSPDQ